MRSWYESDDHGREFLVRAGSGIVVDVAPVGIVDPCGRDTCYRLELHCETSSGRNGMLRFKAFTTAHADHPALPLARDAWSTGRVVDWTAEWHRWQWIRSDVPMRHLNLVTDTQSRLVSLSFGLEVPSFVPSEWTLDA